MSMRSASVRPALFLDRDGVINRDDGYVHTRDAFVFLDGIFDLVRLASDVQRPVVIVTNQSGIARGYFAQSVFDDLMEWVRLQFAANGALVDAVYHCPFHRDAAIETYRVADHPWRKPNPGMLLAARDALSIDMQRSLLIGDQATDLEAAHRAGVGQSIWICGSAPNADLKLATTTTVCRSIRAAIPVVAAWSTTPSGDTDSVPE